MSQSSYERITAQVLKALEGPLPSWRKPWRALRAAGAVAIPVNAISGKTYRGLNFMMLSATDYPDQRWVTFRQAKQLHGHVRRGEHGQTIIYWQIKDVKNEETGETTKHFLMRTYTVFNVAQCEGLKLAAATDAPEAGHPDIEAVTRAIGANIVHGGDVACYSPAADRITMPHVAQFSSADAYAATSLHEIGHWTGHRSRLARDFSGRFGSNAYAAEELVAELTATFLCAELGIDMALENHAAYMAHWRSLCADDSRAIVTAASKAQAAAQFVIEKLGRAAAEAEPAEDDGIAQAA